MEAVSMSPVPLAECPAWITEEPVVVQVQALPTDISGTIVEGRRNETLFKYASKLRGRDGFDEQTIFVLLRELNVLRCNPPLAEDEIRTIAESAAKYEAADSDIGEGGDDSGPGRTKCVDVLLALLKDYVGELFLNETGEAFARFAVDGVQQTHGVNGSVFKRFLMGLYYALTEKAPSSEALGQVIGVAESIPLFKSTKRQTALRCAVINGVNWYDLANEAWQSVEITPGGWNVKASPAEMIRAANMQPQATPERGGTIEALRPFLNVKSDIDFMLVVVWLAYVIAAPDLPKPIICLHGSKGAGKSTFQRVLRRLVDPAAAELTGLSSNDAEIALQCDRNYLLSFDNISKLSTSQSDFLCTIATGGAFSRRKLYTDSEEVIMRFCRPVTMSGINAVAEKTDLLDRCILVELERIGKDNKRTEKKFWAAFDAARPQIMGVLFDGIAAALAAPEVELEELERMADFTEMGYKIARGLGFDGQAFLGALQGNEGKTLDTALKESPLACCIMELLDTPVNKTFEGSSSDLHELLNHIAYNLRLGRVFPKSAAAMSRELRPLKTDLRAVGVIVEEWQIPKTKQTRYKIYREIAPLSPPVSQASGDEALGGGDIVGESSGDIFTTLFGDPAN